MTESRLPGWRADKALANSTRVYYTAARPAAARDGVQVVPQQQESCYRCAIHCARECLSNPDPHCVDTCMSARCSYCTLV